MARMFIHVFCWLVLVLVFLDACRAIKDESIINLESRRRRLSDDMESRAEAFKERYGDLSSIPDFAENFLLQVDAVRAAEAFAVGGTWQNIGIVKGPTEEDTEARRIR